MSVLGTSYCLKRARTGIFRVVENIANGLMNSSRMDISFCCSQKNYYHCIQYLRQNPLLSHSSLVMHNRTIQWNENVRTSKYLEYAGRLYDRIMKKVPIAKNYFISDGVLPKNFLNTIGIYHSPFLPFPEQVISTGNIRKVITVYDIIPLIMPEFFKFREDELLRRILAGIDPDTWILCISESTKNDLCAYKKEIDPQKVVVTHLAASDSFYPCDDKHLIDTVKKKYQIPEGQYILSLSTLEPRKNIDHLIKCYANVMAQENLNDLNLVLIGTKGWDYNKIFETLNKFPQIKNHVVLTDFVEDQDLAPLFAGALVFVYPSFYEGFGLPPLEAMQCGLPAIVSDTSSLPEVVGDAGLLISPTNEDALCQAILSIYKNESLRTELSKKSLERAKLFSWDNCVADTIGVYEKAIEN